YYASPDSTQARPTSNAAAAAARNRRHRHATTASSVTPPTINVPAVPSRTGRAPWRRFRAAAAAALLVGLAWVLSGLA
ncbi:hypothetical protein, partial [Mycobacterium avium]|uniref:hypothetical protein n=1 Tax=Mycobacterium avium TaxID=1764 RepID=UPI001EE69B22